MQIQIQTAPLKVNEDTLETITRKSGGLMKFYERIENCNIVLKKEKSDDKRDFIIEVQLVVPKGNLFASEKADSFGAALDGVIDDLKKQLIKHKERMHNN